MTLQSALGVFGAIGRDPGHVCSGTTAAWLSQRDAAASRSGAGRGHRRWTLCCPRRLPLSVYFQELQSQEEEYSPHRKKMEQEIVQKGMVK